MAELNLLPQHRKLIEASAISEEVAVTRGYRSVTEKRELDGFFGPVQRRVPGLLIPLHDVHGELRSYQLRPDHPRIKDGRVVKYETPRGLKMMLDCPPATLEYVRDPKVQLFITEGVRKADGLASIDLRALALLGVDCWRGTNEWGGKTTLEDWYGVALNGRSVVICFDSDAFQKPAIHQATERLGRWLESRGAELRFVYLPHRADGSKQGVDDFLAGHSRDELLALIETVWHPLPHTTARKARSAFDDSTPLRPTGELLGDVCGVLERFMVLPSEHAATAIALWVLHTWAFEGAHCTPYLVLQSAAKRSAKTRLEELLELLVRGPWRIAAASEAAMFRKIAASTPTLLLDEVDAIFGTKAEGTEPIRAVLNAGNRPGAAVARVVGEGANLATVDFSVYCAKVLAGIITTRWPDTILDRSIIVTLQRKRPDERVEKLRHRKLAAEVEGLRAKLARWAHEHTEALAEAEPELPEQLNDRASEAWEPLAAIADLAGHEWAARARRAALRLTDVRAESDAHGALALAALRDIFDGKEALHTGSILEGLNGDEQLPFADYRKGAGLNSRGLATLLEPYAIKPHPVQIEGVQARGYRREQFTDAWARYCPREEGSEHDDPPVDGSNPSTRQGASDDGGFGHFSDSSAGDGDDGSRTAESLDEHWEVDGLTDATRQQRGATNENDSPDASPGPRQMTVEECIEVAEKNLGGPRPGGPARRTVAEPSDDEWLATFPGATIESEELEGDNPAPRERRMSDTLPREPPMTEGRRRAEQFARSWARLQVVRQQRGLKGVLKEPPADLGDDDVVPCWCGPRRGREWRPRGEGLDMSFTYVSNASYREAVEAGREVLHKSNRSGWVWETRPLGRGHVWQCALCHPPVDRLDVEYRDVDIALADQIIGRLSWRLGYGWRRAGQADEDPLPPVAETPTKGKRGYRAVDVAGAAEARARGGKWYGSCEKCGSHSDFLALLPRTKIKACVDCYEASRRPT